ncbi:MULTISPECIES: hypothetical protein [unclassified Streptomyces]|uniref:hypothetical protein n=1 Tax=unclassified Streptomyces TaxID=2593676 RepID=UPI0027E4DE07|nr:MULTISPECIES: hypothetical protein [unclassified Streptomyces]
MTTDHLAESSGTESGAGARPVGGRLPEPRGRREWPGPHAGYLDVVAVRRDASAPGGESTAIRLLALLPGHGGSCTEIRPDRVRLRIPVSDDAGRRAARRAVREVLADRALLGWAEDRAPGPS